MYCLLQNGISANILQIKLQFAAVNKAVILDLTQKNVLPLILYKLRIGITELERKDKMVHKSLADHLWLVSMSATRGRLDVYSDPKYQDIVQNMKVVL